MKSKNITLALPAQIMLGMILGLILGSFCHVIMDPELIRSLLVVRFFEIGGSLFLNMFRMIVVPVVLISMIRGTASMNNPALLGRIGGKTLICFAVTTMISSLLGICFALFFNIGKGSGLKLPMTADLKLTGSIHSFSETLSMIIPPNLFQSLVEANMLQVIMIALISGITLAKIADKVPRLMVLLEELDIFNMSVVDLILHLAPAGVFCLMAHTFSCFGFSVLLPLLKYILCFLSVSALVLFVLYPLMLLPAGVSPLMFYRKFCPVMLLALSTSSSNAVLPSNIDVVSRKLGVNSQVSCFILSLGATINMNGTAIMQGCAAILISQLYGVPLSIAQIVQIVVMCLLASIGTAGMPSAGVLMLGLVLQSVGLPLSGIVLVLGVDRIVDMFRTVVNITGDAVTAVIVSATEKKLDRNIYNSTK